MVISNLKIGTSYFFTPLEEFAKENIRYQTEFEAKARSIAKQETAKNAVYTQEQWKNALLEKKFPTSKLDHSFFKFESWQRNRSLNYLETDAKKTF